MATPQEDPILSTLLAFRWFRLQACLALAKLPSFGGYSLETLPYLKLT